MCTLPHVGAKLPQLVMVEHLEDLEDVRLYDQVKESNEPSLPLDEAFELIESLRKGK